MELAAQIADLGHCPRTIITPQDYYLGLWRAGALPKCWWSWSPLFASFTPLWCRARIILVSSRRAELLSGMVMYANAAFFAASVALWELMRPTMSSVCAKAESTQRTYTTYHCKHTLLAKNALICHPVVTQGNTSHDGVGLHQRRKQ